MKKRLISVLIPFYNEEKSIKDTFLKVKKIESKLIKKYNFEIMLLDNHSSDKSYDIARSISKKYKNVRLLRHSRNFGYQANILSGYNNCTGDAAVQLDADGQDDPAIISKFIKKWEEGYDVVYGIRKTRKESFLSNFMRKIFYRLLHYIADVKIPIDAGDFRLIDKKIIQSLKRFNEKNIYIRGLISYVGFKQIGIKYDRKERKKGISKFNLIQNIKLAFIAITSFSKKPLQVIFYIGLIVFLISIILSCFYLILFISGNIAVRGFTTIIILFSLFFGVTFLFLGIISLYLGQIQDEVKNRPLYIIENQDEKK